MDVTAELETYSIGDDNYQVVVTNQYVDLAQYLEENEGASIESNIQFGQHPARADAHIAHFIAALNAGQYEQDNEGRLWTQVKIAYVFPKTSARSKKVVWTNKMFNEDIMYDATGTVTYNNLPAQSWSTTPIPNRSSSPPMSAAKLSAANRPPKAHPRLHTADLEY